MTGFDRDIAVRCFREYPPSTAGKLVVDYWLSLWRDNALPQRADFKPKNIARELQAIALFDVVPEKSVICRLIGSALTQGLGRDITGMDWLALTMPADRPVRLQRWSDVARGAIGRGLRAALRESGTPQHSEELMLPFGDVAADGTRQVLYHLSWRQTEYDPTRGGLESVNRASQEFRLVPLRA
ncbi:MAG TPA: PAS domain-containing protein [Rhizomicrobium sp.]|nr:PAS domain-containing protein [Rhizomicrobium sp.]